MVIRWIRETEHVAKTSQEIDTLTVVEIPKSYQQELTMSFWIEYILQMPNVKVKMAPVQETFIKPKCTLITQISIHIYHLCARKPLEDVRKKHK